MIRGQGCGAAIGGLGGSGHCGKDGICVSCFQKAEIVAKVKMVGGTDLDAEEVLAFRRFLKTVPTPKDNGRLSGREIACLTPGWLPYCLGGPAAPEGMEWCHPTAWSTCP